MTILSLCPLKIPIIDNMISLSIKNQINNDTYDQFILQKELNQRIKHSIWNI